MSCAFGQDRTSHQLILEAESLVPSNPLKAADLYMKVGGQYDAAYKPDSAVWSFKQARQLFSRAGRDGDPGLVQACHQLGDIYKYVLYDFNSAEEAYETALFTLIKLDSKDVKTYNRLYYNLAATNRSQLDYKAALTWCRQGIQGARSLHDDVFLERAYSIMGNIYRDMGLYDSASSYYQQGIAVNKLLNRGKPNETLAGHLASLGDAIYRQGKYQLAGERLQQAVNIYDKLQGIDLVLVFHTKRLLAEVMLAQHRMAEAKRCLDEADALRERLKIEKGGPAASIYKSLGDWYRENKDNIRAMESYTKSLSATVIGAVTAVGALPPIGSIELRPFAYDALLASADLLVEEYRIRPEQKLIDQALDRYQLASELISVSRRDLDTEDAKWNYSDTHFQLFERALQAIDLLPEGEKSGYAERAFHVIEKSKAKSLSDALREVELNQALGSNGWMIDHLRELRQRSLVLQHEMETGHSDSTGARLLRNTQAISQLESQIEGVYPSYLEVVNHEQAIDMDGLRDKLYNLNATLVEYFVGSDRVYAAVVTHEAGTRPTFIDLGPTSEIVSLTNHLLTLLHSRTNQFGPTDVQTFVTSAHGLYELLLKPLDNLFGDSKRLIIAPDGVLSQLPFETLLTAADAEVVSFRDLSYLVQTKVISYVPSARQLMQFGPSPLATPRLLAFGFTSGSDVRAPSDVTVDLPGAEVELIALRDKFSGGEFFVGDEVTEANFKREARAFDLLHLAVHGTGNTGSDYSAALYFRDKDDEQDGKLYWYELYGMNLKAQLAVLSSCESGIGKTYRGEGMLSMANAFTFAGCKNVVMGLWKVDDQVSVKLMASFYDALIEGQPIDESLTEAKRTYLAGADQVSSNPKLWASLVAYGESPVIKPPAFHVAWLFVALGVLVLGGVVLYVGVRK